MTRTQEKVMVQAPEMWVHDNFLPLKRMVAGDHWPQVGLLIRGRSLVVFDLCLFDLTEEKIKNARTWEYDSADDLLNDGWVVD